MAGKAPKNTSGKDGRRKENPGATPGPKPGSSNGGPSKAKPENRRGHSASKPNPVRGKK